MWSMGTGERTRNTCTLHTRLTTTRAFVFLKKNELPVFNSNLNYSSYIYLFYFFFINPSNRTLYSLLNDKSSSKTSPCWIDRSQGQTLTSCLGFIHQHQMQGLLYKSILYRLGLVLPKEVCIILT